MFSSLYGFDEFIDKVQGCADGALVGRVVAKVEKVRVVVKNGDLDQPFFNVFEVFSDISRQGSAQNDVAVYDRPDIVDPHT